MTIYVQTHKIMYMEYIHLDINHISMKIYFQMINCYIKEIDATK